MNSPADYQQSILFAKPATAAFGESTIKPVSAMEISNATSDLFDGLWDGGMRAFRSALRKCSIADIDALDEEGVTILSDAAWLGKLRAVRLLIESGANVNKRNAFDYQGGARTFPLLFAAVQDRFDVVEELLGAGADIEQVDGIGATTLVAVTWYGTAKMLRFLIEQGADPDGQPDSLALGLSALHVAAVLGDPERVALLADAGADTAAESKDGCTPIVMAAVHGRHDTAMMLAAKGNAQRTQVCFPRS